MAKNHYQQAKFKLSAAELKQLPSDEGFEVAFIGRSNAGKSTALNALTNQNKLAHTSKTPGRTQMINLFDIDEDRRLVDLPGYGFAKVPEAMKIKWQNLLSRYLQQRDCLVGLVLLMDIRHPLQDLDLLIIEWALQENLALHILLTKADKLKRNPQHQAFQAVKNQLPLSETLSIQLFSGTKKSGVDELRTKLDQWYEFLLDQPLAKS